MLSHAIVGSPDTVRAGLDRFVAQTGADELIIASQLFDHATRLRSFEIVAEIRGELNVVILMAAKPPEDPLFRPDQEQVLRSLRSHQDDIFARSRFPLPASRFPLPATCPLNYNA